jgi:peptide/nickel transport system ATP-binding protein
LTEPIHSEQGLISEGARHAPRPLLAISGLRIDLVAEDGAVPLIEDVSLAIGRGEVLGLVGESGCGKSITAMSILRLLPQPPLRISAGSIAFEAEDLTRLDLRAMRRLRGSRIGMIFQEPMTSLNPTFSIGWQLLETLRLHTDMTRHARRERALELLRLVGIGAPERRLRQYPHELSGGLRQRVMIAMALACNPKLLIADEPTTALDVTIQRQILDLIARLRRELQMAVLLVSHDLGVIAEYADRVAVMYAGRIVEEGAAAAVFARPRHPYTAGLLSARPRIAGRRGDITPIPGTVPSPRERRHGCAFADRCAQALERCRTMRPSLAETPSGVAACWNPVP